jgi:hypothetical protein
LRWAANLLKWHQKTELHFLKAKLGGVTLTVAFLTRVSKIICRNAHKNLIDTFHFIEFLSSWIWLFSYVFLSIFIFPYRDSAFFPLHKWFFAFVKSWTDTSKDMVMEIMCCLARISKQHQLLLAPSLNYLQ